MIKVNGRTIEQNHFPDNSLRIKAPDGLSIPTEIAWFYENDAELFTLICLRRHYEDMPLTLYMPYCPHARMDRVKKETDVFTLKYFCEVINSLNFEEVYITDVHSNVAPALLDRVEVINADSNINQVVNMINDDSLVAFYPDEGAMKRYSEIIDMPFAFGMKKRNWDTGRIDSLVIADGAENIPGNAVLIIDDICSYGGTFLRAAQTLRNAGASAVYLYVTHAEQSMVKGDMYNQDIVDKIFTTDSLFKPELDVRGKVLIV